jgi:hypothetical protein
MIPKEIRKNMLEAINNIVVQVKDETWGPTTKDKVNVLGKLTNAYLCMRTPILNPYAAMREQDDE